tara:strand:+ start:591 stop:902 length:312 start_codon:yes stop_codon:yes gene_type:complete
MDFFEFLKISTIGPQHLRLNEDVLRLIQELMNDEKVLLMCKYCECTLLTEKKNEMCMHIEYFTDTNTDTHVCYDCSKFKNVKRYFGSENLDSDLDNFDDTQSH